MNRVAQKGMPMKAAARSSSRKDLLKRALLKIEELQGRLARAEEYRQAPIAVIGMGCRFPGGSDGPERYWQNLAAGKDGISEIPAARWDADALYDADPDMPGKSYCRSGGFIDQVDEFDPLFFGISPRDAAHMDPQHRLLLEVAWEALEHGGQPAVELRNSNTGVFVGITTQDFSQLLLDRSEATLGTYHLTGMPLGFSAGRLSYTLGLRGPCIAVDTACSSSLVAVHLASQSLRQGECRMALAGGVNLLLRPHAQIVMCKAHILSPSGRCRTFDAAADGIVRSDGCGVVALKRLSDAVADGDRVWAVIRGSAINQDGPSSGITVPNKQAQEQVIRDALASAGVDALQVGYVEAHGTGTPLGDPIEISALAATLCRGRSREQALRVGSVKSNIGHTEAAAGIAGLIKVVLALYHGEIPPHLHLKSRTPHVPWADLPMEVSTMPVPWTGADRVAGVSSFGASGTNSHVIVSAHDRSHDEAQVENERREGDALLVLSARNAGALKQLAHEYREFLLESSGELQDIVYSAGTRRSHHEHRLAVVGATHQEIARCLAEVVEGQEPSGVAMGRRCGPHRPKIAFIFPGQGSQWLGMGRELLATDASFRSAMKDCDAAIARETGWSVLAELEASPEHSRLGSIDVVQPVLFAMAVSLAALWRSWGVSPDAVIGHSMGEVAAAHVAGALDLSDAAAIICRRSRLLRRVSGQGVMAVVELDQEQARECLQGHEDRVSVAVSNSPRSTVLSGEPAAIAEILRALEAREVFCRRIKVDVASHSPQMDPLRSDLLAALKGLKPKAGDIPIYSTVDGEVSSGVDFDAEYWTRNLREPVQFARMVQALLDAGYDGFVEVSPHPILLPAVNEMLARATTGEGQVAVPSLRRDHEQRVIMLESLGSLYRLGCFVDWNGLCPDGGRFVSLPTYPWQRERYWPERASGSRRRSGTGGGAHPLLGTKLPVAALTDTYIYEHDLSTMTTPYLTDHRIYGAVTLPGACYGEMALAGGRRIWPWGGLVVEDLRVHELQVVPESDFCHLQIVFRVIDGDSATFNVSVSSNEETSTERATWVELATGSVRPYSSSGSGEEDVKRRNAAHAEIREHHGEKMDGREFYAILAARGMSFGPAFRGVREIWRGDGEALGRIEVAPESAALGDDHEAHPMLLDACLQVLAAAVPRAADSGFAFARSIAELRVHAPLDGALWSHARFRTERDEPLKGFAGDVTITNDAGEVLAEAIGLQVDYMSPQSVIGIEELVVRKKELRDLLEELERSQWHPHLVELVREVVARVLRLSPEQIEENVAIKQLGADSLMGLEIRNRLEVVLGLPLPATLIWTHPDAVSLARYLCSELEAVIVPAPSSGSGERDGSTAMHDAGAPVKNVGREVSG